MKFRTTPFTWRRLLDKVVNITSYPQLWIPWFRARDNVTRKLPFREGHLGEHPHEIATLKKIIHPKNRSWDCNFQTWRERNEQTLNLMNRMKEQKDMTPKNVSPRSEGIQYATGEEWRRTTNSPRKNEAAGPKWKWHSVMHVSGDESKIWYCKEQYCTGTWNVRSISQGKLDVIKQEMLRINIHILEISELKWTGMGQYNSDDRCIYYGGQEFHRRNGVALIINKRVWNAVLGCNLKNDRMILVHFQGKSFNITVIQVYVFPELAGIFFTTNATWEAPSKPPVSVV